jgi:hypothetical protein
MGASACQQGGAAIEYFPADLKADSFMVKV